MLVINSRVSISADSIAVSTPSGRIFLPGWFLPHDICRWSSITAGKRGKRSRAGTVHYNWAIGPSLLAEAASSASGHSRPFAGEYFGLSLAVKPHHAYSFLHGREKNLECDGVCINICQESGRASISVPRHFTVVIPHNTAAEHKQPRPEASRIIP